MNSKIVKAYVEGIYSEQRYLANWYPSSPIEIGDLGVLSGALWARERTVPAPLLSSGIRVGANMLMLDWGNTKDFTIETKLAGKTTPIFTSLARADAGVAYTFHRGGGVLFGATELVLHEIAETFAVRQWMLDEYADGRISPDTLVVTKLLRARTCAILMSESDQARVEMRISGDVGVAPPAFAALLAHATVTRAVGMYEHIIISDGAIPLFGGLKFSRGFLRGIQVRDALLDTPPTDLLTQSASTEFDLADEDPFEEVGPFQKT